MSRPILAIVSDTIYPYHKGGKEVRYDQLAPRLVDAGFDVHVYTMKWWDTPGDRVERGVRYRGICRVRELYPKGHRSFAQAAWFSLACLKLLWKRYDVLEADQMPLLQILPLRVVAWLRRRRMYATWHEVWGGEYWRKYFGRLGFLASLLEHVSSRLPDHLVTEAYDTRQRLVDFGVPTERISVVPIGLEREIVDGAKPSADAVDVLYVGRLIAHKRVDILLDALARLRDQGQRVTCRVVGEGPDLDELREQVARLGIDDDVRVTGPVGSLDEVYGLMKAARVFALPSVREGFGIAVIEALACGTPVVTTDHADNQARVLVEDGVTGRICPPTVDAFTAALREMLAPEAPFRVDAEEILRTYDWDGLVRRLSSLYWPDGGISSSFGAPRTGDTRRSEPVATSQTGDSPIEQRGS